MVSIYELLLKWDEFEAEFNDDIENPVLWLIYLL